MQVDFIEAGEPGGPFGAKSIGEASVVPAAPAVMNAVVNALNVEIAYCPAVKHLLSRDIVPHESFEATTSVVYETIAKESGFGFEMISYDHATGAASFRFFKA